MSRENEPSVRFGPSPDPEDEEPEVKIYENMERGGAATRAPPGPQTRCGPDRFKLSSAGLVLLCLVFLIIIGLRAYYNVFNHQEPSPGLCPDGWQRLRCSCFFVSSERKNWTESRDDCETRDAHLVVIDNPEKQDYVRSLRTDEELWIGLNYTKGQGWTWVTDSALSFSFFLKGTILVNAESGAAAFMTEGGLWNYSLHGLRCWVCEKEI